jgi:hypothetical protein
MKMNSDTPIAGGWDGQQEAWMRWDGEKTKSKPKLLDRRNSRKFIATTGVRSKRGDADWLENISSATSSVRNLTSKTLLVSIQSKLELSAKCHILITATCVQQEDRSYSR